MEDLLDTLPETLRGRIVSGERLALGWLETRTEAELEVYPTICRIAHEIIAEGLSNKVIQPGVTTTADVRWYYRERIRDLKLIAWFHPSVSVQRPASDDSFLDLFSGQDEVIHRGDLVHIDFGITYLDLNTDTQQMAYVLRHGETTAPEGILRGFHACNRVQDILTAQFETGRSGNEILAGALEQCRAEGLEATIYSHPIGFHGHGGGPTIGLWDQQDGVPGRGDYELMPDTAYSIELNAAVTIPEWGDQTARIMLEEDAFFDGVKVWYLDGRQTTPWLIH
jgi:Xaa-Pro aminopeptidase